METMEMQQQLAGSEPDPEDTSRLLPSFKLDYQALFF